MKSHPGEEEMIPECGSLRDVPSRESRQARKIKVLLRTLAAVPPRYLRGQRQGPEFFDAYKAGIGKMSRLKHDEGFGNLSL